MVTFKFVVRLRQLFAVIVCYLCCTSALFAQSAANKPLTAWDHQPNGSQAPKAELPPVWRGGFSDTGADKAQHELPGAWGALRPKGNEAANVQPETAAAPMAAAGPVPAALGAHPQLDQAILGGAIARLRNLGFLSPVDDDELAISEAVRRYQASISLPVTGILDRDTLGRLLLP